jgi:hypothetical protein
MFNERDEEKKKMCIDKGISLISIPYWYGFYSEFAYYIHLNINLLLCFNYLSLLPDLVS